MIALPTLSPSSTASSSSGQTDEIHTRCNRPTVPDTPSRYGTWTHGSESLPWNGTKKTARTKLPWRRHKEPPLTHNAEATPRTKYPPLVPKIFLASIQAIFSEGNIFSEVTRLRAGQLYFCVDRLMPDWLFNEPFLHQKEQKYNSDLQLLLLNKQKKTIFTL